MTRSDQDRVADILDACRRLSEVAKLGRAEYDRNWIVQSAVERQLEIIGEAASRLSEDFQGSHVGLPARQAKALRNVISHEYFSVNLPDDAIAEREPAASNIGHRRHTVRAVKRGSRWNAHPAAAARRATSHRRIPRPRDGQDRPSRRQSRDLGRCRMMQLP